MGSGGFNCFMASLSYTRPREPPLIPLLSSMKMCCVLGVEKDTVVVQPGAVKWGFVQLELQQHAAKKLNY